MNVGITSKTVPEFCEFGRLRDDQPVKSPNEEHLYLPA
jgi:hypothetical protein